MHQEVESTSSSPDSTSTDEGNHERLRLEVVSEGTCKDYGQSSREEDPCLEVSLKAKGTAFGSFGHRGVAISILLDAMAPRKAKQCEGNDFEDRKQNMKKDTAKDETDSFPESEPNDHYRRRFYGRSYGRSHGRSLLLSPKKKKSPLKEEEDDDDDDKPRMRAGPASSKKRKSDLLKNILVLKPKYSLESFGSLESRSRLRFNISKTLRLKKEGAFLSSYIQFEERTDLRKNEERSLVKQKSDEKTDTEFVISRVKDIFIKNDGELSAIVEWKDWPGEDTVEPLTNISNTKQFSDYECLLKSVFGLKSNMESRRVLLKFKKILFNLQEDCSRSDSRSHSIALMLKLLNKRPEYFDSDLKRDYNALKHEVKTKLRFFFEYSNSNARQSQDNEDSSEEQDDKLRIQETSLHCLLMKETRSTVQSIFEFMNKRMAAQDKTSQFFTAFQEQHRSGNVILFRIENFLDTEYLSKDDFFEFITENEVHPDSSLVFGCNIDNIPCGEYCSCSAVDVECGLAFPEEPCPCFMRDDCGAQEHQYDVNGRLNLQGKDDNDIIIYECNPSCPCILSKKCSNSTVTSSLKGHGITIRVTIFRSSSQTWSLRTETEIPANTFVSTMVGQLSLLKEFMAKESESDGKRVMCLDYHPDLDPKRVAVIDSSRKGNLFSRFLRHSCQPNLVMKVVFSGNYDPYLPTIALFSNQKIEKYSELTVDFNFFDGQTRREDLLDELTGKREDNELSFNGGLFMQPNTRKLTKCQCLQVLEKVQDNRSMYMECREENEKGVNVDCIARPPDQQNHNFCRLFI